MHPIKYLIKVNITAKRMGRMFPRYLTVSTRI